MSAGEDEQQVERPVAFAITGGGEPTPEQLAAVTVALTPVAVAADDDASAHPMRSGWARAAMVEGIGGRTAVSLADLQQGRFGLGHVGDPRAPLA